MAVRGLVALADHKSLGLPAPASPPHHAGGRPQSAYKPLKFRCAQRTLLLVDLYQCVEAAAALGRCAIAAKLLG